MAARRQHQFSGPVTIFQEIRLPEKATPAGYSALIDAYKLAVPLPRTLSATGEHHRIIERDGWRIMTPRHAPHPTLEGHLTFALKYEGLDLAVLKRLFLATGPAPIEALVRESPTGSYARRIWFLYEWLTGTRLDLPDANAGRYVPVVDPDLQWAAQGKTASALPRKGQSARHTGFLPAGFPHQGARRIHRPRSAAARAGDRRGRAARSSRTDRRLPSTQGLAVQLRDRGRASAAGPHPALGPRHRRGRSSAA